METKESPSLSLGAFGRGIERSKTQHQENAKAAQHNANATSCAYGRGSIYKCEEFRKEEEGRMRRDGK